MCCKKKLLLLYFMLLSILVITLKLYKVVRVVTVDRRDVVVIQQLDWFETTTTSADAQNSDDVHINAAEQFAATHQQRGCIFNASGASLELSVTMTSALIHDFTPHVSREAERRFVDPAGGNVFHVMSPAMTYHEGR